MLFLLHMWHPSLQLYDQDTEVVVHRCKHSEAYMIPLTSVWISWKMFNFLQGNGRLPDWKNTTSTRNQFGLKKKWLYITPQSSILFMTLQLIFFKKTTKGKEPNGLLWNMFEILTGEFLYLHERCNCVYTQWLRYRNIDRSHVT